MFHSKLVCAKSKQAQAETRKNAQTRNKSNNKKRQKFWSHRWVPTEAEIHRAHRRSADCPCLADRSRTGWCSCLVPGTPYQCSTGWIVPVKRNIKIIRIWSRYGVICIVLTTREVRPHPQNQKMEKRKDRSKKGNWTYRHLLLDGLELLLLDLQKLHRLLVLLVGLCRHIADFAWPGSQLRERRF